MEYYLNNYSLAKDEIVSFDQITTIDERTNHFKRRLADGGTRDLTIEDMQSDICNLQLIPFVPEEVSRVFFGAKRLYIYGYFEYYFYTICFHYLFLAVEAALRIKHKQVIGKTKKHLSMYNIINSLLKEGILVKEDEKIYKEIMKLRNSLSHLDDSKLLFPSASIIERCAVLINSLFDSKD